MGAREEGPVGDGGRWGKEGRWEEEGVGGGREVERGDGGGGRKGYSRESWGIRRRILEDTEENE